MIVLSECVPKGPYATYNVVLTRFGHLLWACNWNFDILRIKKNQPSSNNEKMILSCPCHGDDYWNVGVLGMSRA